MGRDIDGRLSLPDALLSASVERKVEIGGERGRPVVGDVGYNAAEALPNLVNPFWMLPLLGILKLKARDLVGYSVLQMILHVPIVFFLCWLFAQYIPYIPPIR